MQAVLVDAQHGLHQRTGERVALGAGPVGERGDGLGQLAVAVGLAQLLADGLGAVLLMVGGPMAQHQVGEVHVEGMRRHIGTLGHEAHVAERAGLHDLGVVRLRHPIDLAGRPFVDHVEQSREAVAQIEAAPAAVTDVEHPLHLRLDGGEVVEGIVPPLDRMTGRRLEAAFAGGVLGHWRFRA